MKAKRDQINFFSGLFKTLEKIKKATILLQNKRKKKIISRRGKKRKDCSHQFFPLSLSLSLKFHDYVIEIFPFID